MGRFFRHAPAMLVGREKELSDLDTAWADPNTHVLTIIAWGGVGKTSLVANWMATRDIWNKVEFEKVFDWSFYTHGTSDMSTASSDQFIAVALEFFGDAVLARSAVSPWDKGARLAQLIAQKRTLLVLDGLEPLQHPPTSPFLGQSKDPALTALLKGLAAKNPGLCIVTTREHVADLVPFQHTTAPEWQLQPLYLPAGIELLKKLGVRGLKAEFEQLVQEVKGHALTLNLLGRYLAAAHGGDIRKRDLVKFKEADAEEQGGHAFRVMDTYSDWLAAEGERSQRALAVLRLLGLFDRPADSGCLTALRTEPAIPGLTEALMNLTEADWNLAVNRLADCGLISIQKTSFSPSSIDAHPLIREYFAERLRQENHNAWRSAHYRLYEHLKGSACDKPVTLEEMEPLVRAVHHGCHAGCHQQTFKEVYLPRIRQSSEEKALWRKLGAISTDLALLANYFSVPWRTLVPGLDESNVAWLLNAVGFRLFALGRLAEAAEPTELAFRRSVDNEMWEMAAKSGGTLGAIQLSQGRIQAAIASCEKAAAYADKSGLASQKVSRRCRLANSLFQAGEFNKAGRVFRTAEVIQNRLAPGSRFLFGLNGFHQSELLLTQKKTDAVISHAVWALRRLRGQGLLDLALDNLCLGRGRFLRVITRMLVRNECAIGRVERGSKDTTAKSEPLGLSWFCDQAFIKLHFSTTTNLQRSKSIANSLVCLNKAVDGLRQANQRPFLPHGLIVRAECRACGGDSQGAKLDLDEAMEIAERGSMLLHVADIHLHRARLFFHNQPYPWTSPQEDLATARQLIERCGYWRRKEELENAEKIIAS